MPSSSAKRAGGVSHSQVELEKWTLRRAASKARRFAEISMAVDFWCEADITDHNRFNHICAPSGQYGQRNKFCPKGGGFGYMQGDTAFRSAIQDGTLRRGFNLPRPLSHRLDPCPHAAYAPDPCTLRAMLL